MAEPEFIPRKVMKMGKSSGVISLPKSWAETAKLKAGGTVLTPPTSSNFQGDVI